MADETEPNEPQEAPETFSLNEEPIVEEKPTPATKRKTRPIKPDAPKKVVGVRAVTKKAATTKVKGKGAAKATVDAGKSKDKENALRKPQLRVLKALVEAGADAWNSEYPFTKLVKACKVSAAMVRFAVGPVDEALRDAHDKKVGYRSLLTRGMVKTYYAPDAEVYYYFVTPLGKRAYEKATGGERAKFTAPNKNQHAAKS